MLKRTLGVLVAALLAGCTPSSGDPATPSQPPTPAPSHDDAGEADALAAYEGMWDVVVDASHEGIADADELDSYATGDALALMQQTLQGASDDDVTVVGEPESSPEVTEISGDQADVLDCMDDSQWVEQGGSESDEPGQGPRKIDATITHDGLTWRVSEMRIYEQGSC